MHVDAQTKSSQLDFVGLANFVLLDCLAVDQCAHDWVIVFHCAGLTVEAQGGVAR
jgi:hydrogenase maturation factor